MSVTIPGQWSCWRRAGRITSLFKSVCGRCDEQYRGGVVRTRFLKSSHFSLFLFLLVFPRALAQLCWTLLWARRAVDSGA